MYTMHVACSGGGQRRALGPLNWTVTDGCESPYMMGLEPGSSAKAVDAGAGEVAQ